MTGTWGAMLSTVGLGIAYFIGAIPAGVAMKLDPAVAALCAWIGYAGIGAAMLLIGAPAQAWVRRKFKISSEPDTTKVFWRVWLKAGLPGLALLAPVTCGPYFAVLIALALGEKPARAIAWVTLACIPWCVVFAVLAGTAAHAIAK